MMAAEQVALRLPAQLGAEDGTKRTLRLTGICGLISTGALRGQLRRAGNQVSWKNVGQWIF
jgi:hypothetical protein